MPVPRAPEGSGLLMQWGYILFRELPGILLTAAYLLVLPAILGVFVFREKLKKMGIIRFMVLANLMLMMAMLPIKMILRWTINLKYIISIPEYFLNL